VTLRLACITAHPDDESLGFGGALARYAAEGVEVSLIVATRGERGRYGDGSEPHPGEAELGRIREAELRAAADVLGVRNVRFLDYLDGELDRADPVEATGRIARYLRELRPDVLLTFDPYGVYGHPDHVAICQLALAGSVRAASPDAVDGGPDRPHQVKKAYYRSWTRESCRRFLRTFKVLQSKVDGEVRPSVSWPDWAVTTVTPAHAHWETVWAAVRCHRTQMAQYGALAHLTDEDHRELWGAQEYCRVFSLVNGGRARESDFFQGLR
jgi:LmbE family N-acetylglucosaminyl deacetylase